MFGITNYLLPVLLVVVGLSLIMRKRENRFRTFKLGLSVLISISFLAFLVEYNNLYSPNAGVFEFFQIIYTQGTRGVAGGVLGGLAMPFVSFFGLVGTWIIFVCVLIIAILKLTGVHPAAIVAFFVRKFKKATEKRELHRNIEKEFAEPKPKKHEVEEKVPFEKFDLAKI